MDAKYFSTYTVGRQVTWAEKCKMLPFVYVETLFELEEEVKTMKIYMYRLLILK